MLRTAADCHVRSRSVRHDIHISVLLLSLFGSKSCFGSKAFLFVSGDVAWIIKRSVEIGVYSSRTTRRRIEVYFESFFFFVMFTSFRRAARIPAPADILTYE